MDSTPQITKNIPGRGHRIAQNRYRVLEYLLEHPCIDCGEKDVRCLEFDHVRGEKVAPVTTLIKQRASWTKIWEEINKCVVRCSNCHRKKDASKTNHWSLRFMN